MAIARVNVSIEDSYLPRFSEVVRRCKRIGLKVEHELAATGVVTGEIDADRLDALGRVKGVATVERSREIRLPPPTSDVQ
jgi:hypothetical protein